MKGYKNCWAACRDGHLLVSYLTIKCHVFTYLHFVSLGGLCFDIHVNCIVSNNLGDLLFKVDEMYRLWILLILA